ncbi:MAG TPA: hypothetical protein VF530_13760 [Planctomycetota bacterium]
MIRPFTLALAALGIALVPTALRALDSAEPVAAPVEPAALEAVTEVVEPEVAEPFADGMMPPSWTFVGCISLSGTCKDVFVDGDGAYWVCKACGTTNSPGPGKCRRLTAYELQNSLWCS